MTGAALSPGEASLILFGIFFGLMALRVPVAVALGLACLPVLALEERLSPMTLVQETFNAYNSFILLAVPFFLLTANLMNVGGITDRLVRLSRDLVGHFPGRPGAGQRGAVDLLRRHLGLVDRGRGEPVEDLHRGAEQGRLRRQFLGRDHRGLGGAGGDHPAVDPDDRLGRPAHGVDRRAVPRRHHSGPAIGLVQMATVHAYAKLRGYPTYPRATLVETVKAIGVALPALMTPVIIIGGKIFGWFTATESACIAVLYAGVLSIIVYREMNLKGLNSALLDTGKLAGIALFCVGTASAFGWLLAYYQIPKALLAGVGAWGMGPIQTGFFIAAVFLVVGCFLDAIPAIIIVGTILEPLAKAVGMDPIHFAMIGIVSLAFGLVTPPYGLCLMISCSIAGIRMRDALKDTFIMLLPMLGVLALVILWPSFSLFLPRLFPPGTL